MSTPVFSAIILPASSRQVGNSGSVDGDLTVVQDADVSMFSGRSCRYRTVVTVTPRCASEQVVRLDDSAPRRRAPAVWLELAVAVLAVDHEFGVEGQPLLRRKEPSRLSETPPAKLATASSGRLLVRGGSRGVVLSSGDEESDDCDGRC